MVLCLARFLGRSWLQSVMFRLLGTLYVKHEQTPFSRGLYFAQDDPNRRSVTEDPIFLLYIRYMFAMLVVTLSLLHYPLCVNLEGSR